MEIAGLWVKLGLSASEFKNGLGMAQASLKGFSENVEKLQPTLDKINAAIKWVGLAAAGGFTAAVAGSVKGATALESYRQTLNIVMKDQQKAAQVMAWAVEFANRTPFETSSIIEATVRLQAYGLEAQKVLPAIGDMAGVMNKDIMDAVEAVADAQTGELERLKEFGITKQMIIDQGNKIMRDKQLVNNQGQIIDQENFNKALFSLLEERFKGGMEIQATSFKGLWSTVVGVFKTSLATMAGISATGEVKIGGLFDNLKKKMQEIINRLNEWQKNGQLQEWADRVSAALGAMWKIAETVFGALAKAGSFVADNWKYIEPILVGVGAALVAMKVHAAALTVRLAAVTAAQWALNVAMGANPIGAVIIAIGALVAAGVALYRNWDKIKIFGIQAWGELKLFVLRAIDGLLRAYEKLWGWVPVIGDKIRQAREGMDSLVVKEQAIVNARRLAKEMAGTEDETRRFSEQVKRAAQDTAGAVPAIGNLVAAASNLRTAATGSSAKASKAAEDTRAAWERTADILSTRLQILQSQQEIAALAAERHGNQAQALADKITWLNRQLDVQKQIVAAVNQGYQESVRVKGANAEETLKLAARLEQERKAQADIEKQIYDTTQALKDQAKALRDLAGDVAKLAEEYEAVEKKMREDLVAAAEEYQRKVAEVNRKLAEDERKLTEQYEAEVERRAKALRDFVGLFDKVTTKEVSGKELLENLRGQVKTFEEWSANIQALAARGVDEGLIQELREMGPKAAPEIAALNTLTDTELAEYVALWRTKNEEARAEAINQLTQQRIEMQQKLIEIRIAAQEQLEQYRVEWEKKNAQIRKNAEEEMARIEKRFKEIAEAGTKYGVSLMTNFIGGIESQFERLRSTLEAMAATVDSYMPRSPAKRGPLRRLMEWGPALVGGLVDGIKASLPKLESITAGMAALSPAALAPAVANSYSTSNVYGGSTIIVNINGTNAREIWRELEPIFRREVYKTGTRV